MASVQFRFNGCAALVALLILVAEIGIAVFVKGGFVRWFVGDVLAVTLVFFALRSLWPTSAGWLAVLSFGFACLIEVSQLFAIPERLGFSRTAPLGIVAGSVFDPLDFLAYALGAIVSFVLDRPLARP